MMKNPVDFGDLHVKQLLTDKDGLVRGAVVKVTSGKDRVTELQQPIQLLYPLEVDYCVCQPNEIQQDAEGKGVGDANTNNQVPCKGVIRMPAAFQLDDCKGLLPIR